MNKFFQIFRIVIEDQSSAIFRTNSIMIPTLGTINFMLTILAATNLTITGRGYVQSLSQALENESQRHHQPIAYASHLTSSDQ
jgi:hypothetical protein